MLGDDLSSLVVVILSEDGLTCDRGLIWIDLEMTGLCPRKHRIIEIAVLVTDVDLNLLGEGVELAVHQSDAHLSSMDDWNLRVHTESGLIDRVRASNLDERSAAEVILKFLGKLVPPRRSPICGSSVGKDRQFLAHHMPELDDYFHYRYLDVGTLRELVHRWKPEILPGSGRRSAHRAMEDVRGSISELGHYRRHLFGL